MENKNIKSEAIGESIKEEQLAEVAGGFGHDSGPATCYFTPKSCEPKIESDGSCWIECASGCFGCACRHKHQCKDRWHLIEQSTGKLLPLVDAFNHHKKHPSNNYNTY